MPLVFFTRDYWEHLTEAKKQKVAAFLSKEGIQLQYTAGLPDELLTRVSPETWLLDWERMNRPGNVDMQFELNCDYKHHLEMFPVFHHYFRTHQPPALVIWGRHDAFFSVEEAPCYKRICPMHKYTSWMAGIWRWKQILTRRWS